MSTSPSSVVGMGYQPGLDGLRAISVIAVIIYHAGFGWMSGGFLGVEVFFVVSGYLITGLLIDERERSGTVSLKGFWTRRARRLFPALAVVLVAVTLWALLAGSAEQAAQVKRDLPWAIGYLANWGQIVGGVPYFAAVDPPLLRHLWSLAVEEQWYVLWPFAFIALSRAGMTLRRRVSIVAVAVVAAWMLTWWVHRDAPKLFLGWDPTNAAYLSTPTRASGLLLGALAAFVWRPWRDPQALSRASRPLDVTAGLAVGVLVSVFIGAHLTEGYMYPWVMGLTSLASVVAIAVVVHPGAVGARWIFGSSWLTAIGRRSYGLYLWHWPIFVIAGATDGSWWRFVGGSLVTVIIAEASFRLIETPVRHGALGRWWSAREGRSVRWVAVGGSLSAVVVLTVAVASVDEFDIAVGGEDVEFSLSASELLATTSTTRATSTSTTVVAEPTESTVATSSTTTTSTSTTTTTLPVLPRSISIVGDSTAISFGVNLPSGLDETFAFSGAGGVVGCSIWDAGTMVSSRGTRRNFAPCSGWQDTWSTASDGYDVALVIIGAWDVYDMANIDGSDAEPEVITPFGSELWDATFVSNMTSGVAALRSVGAQVAVLEVPCMRPQEVAGQGFPPTPERGDDDRVAHVNALLRSVADADDHVHFITGPVEWCTDEAIATDLGYRWDGVHVYKPGANLILETIAGELLRIPVVQD